MVSKNWSSIQINAKMLDSPYFNWNCYLYTLQDDEDNDKVNNGLFMESAATLCVFILSTAYVSTDC